MIKKIKSFLRRLFAMCRKYPSCPKLSAEKKEVGQFGEAYTALNLEKKGYTILERNLRLLGHELDIVAQKGNTIVFCEVKTRCQTEEQIAKYGRPAMAVDHDQKRNIRHAASSYVRRCGEGLSYRFDIAEVYLKQGKDTFLLDKLCYIEDAFR